MMTPADLTAIRAELADCRRHIDGALGRSLQLVDLIEAEYRERQRESRLTDAERSTLGAP